jgi:hypothetical protein
VTSLLFSQSQGIQGIQGASQSMPADFTAMGTTPKDCVASTTKQLRFVGLNSSKTCQAILAILA